MKKIVIGFTAILFFVFLLPFVGKAKAPSKSMEKSGVLKAKGVTGTFVILKANSAWKKTDEGTRKSVLEKVKNLLAQYSNKVEVDAHDTSSLMKKTNIFLRLHSRVPNHNNLFIKELLSTQILGAYFSLQDARWGITKGLNYATEFPDLLARLKASKYEGETPIFGIMVTVDKTAQWWNLPHKERLEMIKEHTVETLPFIKDVKRKLYHSTGLGATDFITYFETANLKAFNELIIALKSVREGQYTTYGTPVMGYITTFDELIK